MNHTTVTMWVVLLCQTFTHHISSHSCFFLYLIHQWHSASPLSAHENVLDACFAMCGSPLHRWQAQINDITFRLTQETLIWCMGPSPCAHRLYVCVAVCACGSTQRLIHNNDRKYSIISSHSVIFPKQQGGERRADRTGWERGGLAIDWKRWRWSETKTDGGGNGEMKHMERWDEHANSTPSQPCLEE